MRKIKFRAWDSVCSSYVKDDWRLYLRGGVSISECWANEVILEQFTGLVDRDGREVYEGDIVQCFGLYATTGFTSPVEWNIAGFCVKQPSQSDFAGFVLTGLEHWCGHNQLKVLGNIHKGIELKTAQRMTGLKMCGNTIAQERPIDTSNMTIHDCRMGEPNP